jgi:hypothetical protein
LVATCEKKEEPNANVNNIKTSDTRLGEPFNILCTRWIVCILPAASSVFIMLKDVGISGKPSCCLARRTPPCLDPHLPLWRSQTGLALSPIVSGPFWYFVGQLRKSSNTIFADSQPACLIPAKAAKECASIWDAYDVPRSGESCHAAELDIDKTTVRKRSFFLI